MTSQPTPPSHRFKVSEKRGSGLSIKVYEVASLRRFVQGTGQPGQQAGQGLVESYQATGQRQVRFVLEGSGILLEPGAFLYSRGNLTTAVRQHERGNLLSRALRSAGSGESAFATSFEGRGEVWTELTHQHFVIAELGPGEDFLLDDRAFFACQQGVTLSTHLHTSLAGALSGNGLAQPRLSGQGLFVVESPVPAEEIEVVELRGDEMTLDGDLLLMYSAALQVQVRPLVPGLRNALRSGEGLVYALRGHGQVFFTPTHKRLSVAAAGTR